MSISPDANYSHKELLDMFFKGMKSIKENEKKYPLHSEEGEVVTNAQRLARYIMESLDELELKDNLEDSDVQMHNHSVSLMRDRITKIIQKFVPEKEKSLASNESEEYMAIIRNLESALNQTRHELGNARRQLQPSQVQANIQGAGMTPGAVWNLGNTDSFSI